MQQCCIDDGGQLALAGPIDIIASDGSVFFTENQGYIDRGSREGPNTKDPAFTLADTAIGEISRGGYSRRLTPTPYSGPHFLVRGPLHRIYFTEARGDMIGFFNASSPGQPIREAFVGTHRTPVPMIIGPDGAPWFAELGFDFAQPGGAPPQGDTVGAIRRFDPQRRVAGSAFVTGPFTFPSEMAIDSSGRIWFSEPQVFNQLGRLDTDSGVIDHFQLPAGSNPSGIVEGTDRAIWFAERGASAIGCVRPSDELVFHYLLGLTAVGRSKEPARMIQGPGFGPPGSMSGIWFSEVANNALGQLDGTCGGDTVQVVEWQLPAYVARHARPGDSVQSDFPAAPSRNPFGLAYDPAEHAIFFTETKTSSIGRLSLP